MSNKKNFILKGITSVINEILIDSDKADMIEVHETSSLISLGLDSLQILQLVDDIEKNFNISIPNESVYEFENINDIISFISDATQEQYKG